MKKMLYPILCSMLLGIGFPMVGAEEVPERIRAADFATTGSNLTQLQADIQSLESLHGRYDHQLVEPMRQLASELLAANRYSDAADTVRQAIQITRMANGLFTPEQYDLLEFGLDIARLRQDWDGFNEQLTHYRWLLGSRYRGNATNRLARMLRLAHTHVLGAFDDSLEQLSSHLMNATYINEVALAYAQKTGQTDTPVYLEALYGLTEKYFLETRAIFGDGKSSYYLRQHGPDGATDERRDAVARRFRAGLEKLEALHSTVARSQLYGLEAQGMVELHIADWHALFGADEELFALYAHGMATLREAGVSDARLSRFFANPVILPRPRLELSVDHAMSHGALAMPAGEARDPTSDRLLHRVQVLEPSERIPGFSRDLTLLDWGGSHREDWSSLRLTLALRPQERESFQLGGYLTHSHVSGSDVQLLGTLTEEVEQLDSVLSRVRSLVFRPAFRDGKAISSEIALDYVFDSRLRSSLTPQVVARTPVNSFVSGSQAPGPSASLVAAGE